MRLARRLLAVPACAAWLIASPAPALAAAPINDNYLSSLQMLAPDNRVSATFDDSVDTTEATTQLDLFDPNRDGIPFGGAGPEETRCGDVEYGKSVWYDFSSAVHGGARIIAGGYDTVVRVYRYDPLTSQITRTLVCQNAGSGSAEQVDLPRVKRGAAYTVQIAGAGAGPAAASGLLGLSFVFFSDRDRDDVLDAAPDRCPELPGILQAGGCPPSLRPNTRIGFDATAAGLRLTRFDVGELPPGSRVTARCRACGVGQRKVVRRSSVSLDELVGTDVAAGSRLEIFSTHRRTRAGRFRHGAIGSYIRFDVEAGSLGRRTVRCLKPGSRVPRKRCT